MTSVSRRAGLAQRVRKLALGGAASVAASVVASNLLRIVSSMTLTRLLDSTAYGVVGIITSIAYMLTMLSDVGLYAFIVRHADGESPRFLDEVWTIRLLRGAGLAALMVALSGPAAAFLGKPTLGPVIAVWSVSFLIDGLSSLAFATAVRAQKLWRISAMELAANVVTLVCSIAFALVLHSYWSLVIGMTVGASVKALLSYLMFADTRRRWAFNYARSRELWGFSRYIAMSSMLSLLVLQADKVVLARMMPLAVYGFYAIAVTLASAPEAIASPYATRVLYPIYARFADTPREALRATYYGARRRVTVLYMAGVGAMLGTAPLIIAVLYDPRYRAVATFLAMLSCRVVLRMPNYCANEVLVAIGRTRETLISNIFRIGWLAVGGATGIWRGDIWIIVATVSTDELPALLCYWWTLRRERLLDLREESYGIVAAIAGAGLGWGATMLLEPLIRR